MPRVQPVRTRGGIPSYSGWNSGDASPVPSVDGSSYPNPGWSVGLGGGATPRGGPMNLGSMVTVTGPCDLCSDIDLKNPQVDVDPGLVGIVVEMCSNPYVWQAWKVNRNLAKITTERGTGWVSTTFLSEVQG